MIIRRAILTDVPEIMQLIAGVVPVMQAAGNFQWSSDYPNPEVFESDIAQEQLWVAEDAGEIAGVIAITTDQSPEYADVGWDINETAIVVHRLAVSVNHQGKGAAALMMHQAEAVARERGIHIMRIDTNSTNKVTRQLFPKLGYDYVGEIGLAFRPNLRFYCYEKFLS